MYINVKLLNGFTQPLTYKIPDEWSTEDLTGSLVHVPVKNKIEIALVQEVFADLSPSVTFTIRHAHDRETLPQDKLYKRFIDQLSNYYCVDPLHFYQRVRHFLQAKECDSIKTSDATISAGSTIELTQEQETIVNSIAPTIGTSIYYPTLIHGVTGSGKTEIYKQCIVKAYQAQKTTVLLLPEVSLAVQFTKLLTAQLPSSISLFGFHSATSITEKRALWQQLLKKQPLVIIGVHLPVLLPIANLGLIVIDEEHEIGFQEKKHPKVNTKEAALLRGQLYKIPVVMGSATPSMSSLYNVEKRNWHFFQLKHRFKGAFPVIQQIKLNNTTKRAHFWLSNELVEAIKIRLAQKEQTILFLNRRGYSFFIQCKKCSFIPSCNQCSVSLTLHNNQQLRCHYCNFSQLEFFTCPSCKAGQSSLIKKGIGTQQLAALLEKLLPNARIARADLDATINKKKWQQTVSDFEHGELDILVGTQTITKGYHFPKVTLVGIIWADINLGLPFYNAAETTLAQIIQVAGRAGRQSKESLVIIQSMLDHPVFNYVAEVDYARFYDYEMTHRQEVHYPPFIRFAEIELKNENAKMVDDEATMIVEHLARLISQKSLAITLLGPAQPPVHMIKNVHARKIYLKAASITDIIKLYQLIERKKYASSVFFTPNPLS